MSEEKNAPQISVIIPMYNVEDYVGECLDSLLCQTFQDFEVIIVDDCSTDGSREVVKNYLPKFDGKLRLIESEKNSGCCSIPRRIGMKYATGKYVFFLDSDDMIIKTAFERLYNIAEKFQADVVQCEKFFASETPHLKSATLTIRSFKPSGYVTVPTLDTENIKRRIEACRRGEYVWMDWTRLVRRDFMLENGIEHPPILYEEDLLFTIYCISCAKRYVKIPDTVNIYRYRPNSVMHSRYSLIGYVRKWTSVLATGFSHCDKFLSSVEYYKQHPEVKYLALDILVQDIFSKLVKIYKNFSPSLLDDMIREEFAKVGDNSAMAAFFFNMSILSSLKLGTHFLNQQK